MIKSEFEKEIEAAFELAYTPVMLVKQRLNGQDFLETAVPLLDQIRDKYGESSDKVKIAARTMVLAFNDKLNPQMSAEDLDGMIKMLVNNGPLVRMFGRRKG